MSTSPMVESAMQGPDEVWSEVLTQMTAGARFAGMYADAVDDGLEVRVLLAASGQLHELRVLVAEGVGTYPSLTPLVPAAAWYERVIHDLYGVVPAGHPRLLPLVLERSPDSPPPRPGSDDPPEHVAVSAPEVGRLVTGYGLFTIPHGPVRSGITETVQYLVETPGEDIPRVWIRPAFKHRGIDARFGGLDIHAGVLLAERVEGVASVAHALAFSHAIERLSGATPPPRARLVRVLHAELERIANHLDVAIRLSDAAGLAVATARFSWHKEKILRLVSRLSGSRFGRGVVVPGGVTRAPDPASAQRMRAELTAFHVELGRDVRALMALPSFLDRLRGTGPLSLELARSHGALGPIGRASGCSEDIRLSRPYDAYGELGDLAVPARAAGDAMARLNVRWDEIDASFTVLDRVAAALGGRVSAELHVDLDVPDGRATGWAEAPQGELIYAVRITGGLLSRCAPRTASFHNLVLFHDLFVGDILTDFPFTEASFGISMAGVAL